MPPYRLLCLLLFPLLAVNAADDLEEEYATQGKTSNSHDLSEPLPLPSDGVRIGGRLMMPKIWAAMFDRLSAEAQNPLSNQDEPVNKRVFCNGFTGCGGRFRGRRRQHPANPGKRPFCNISGCGNMRKRDEIENKPVAQKTMRLPEAIRKRLFCNAYDGCRGKKRALYSNWLSRLEGIADNL